MTDEWHTEITVFQKSGGVLSKKIRLDHGKVVSDGSACVMSNGVARRVDITDIRAYADLINACPSNEAVALGRLKVGVQTPVRVTAAHELNGHDQTTIARTKDFLIFGPEKV